jgi:cell division protein FtsB
MNLKVDMGEYFRRLRDAVGRSRLSRVEIAFLGAAILFASAVAFFYSYEVAPLSFTLAARQKQIQELKARIADLNTRQKKALDQASNAEKILESLRGFESRLTSDQSGMTQIINEIDALSVTHKMITSDSNYHREDADEPKLDENGALKLQPNRNKAPKIYPNFNIDTTVVGDYPNLRRFLSDLERSKQFLIVNSLSFQGGDDRTLRQLEKGGKKLELSGQEAVPVSLKIELDTYYRPPSVASVASVTPVAPVGIATAQNAQSAPKNAR